MRLRRYPRIRTEDRGSCFPPSHSRTRHEHAKSTRYVSHAGHGRLQLRSPRPGVPDPIGPASSSTHTTSCSARARPLLLAFRCDRSASCPSRLRGVPCVVFGTCAAQYEAFERPRVVARACCGRTSKVRRLRSGGGGRLQWRLGEDIESNDEGIDETEGRCSSAGMGPRSEKGGRFAGDSADEGNVCDEDPRGGRRRTAWIVGSDRRWRSTVEISSPPTRGERRPTAVPNGRRCDRTTSQIPHPRDVATARWDRLSSVPEPSGRQTLAHPKGVPISPPYCTGWRLPPSLRTSSQRGVSFPSLSSFRLQCFGIAPRSTSQAHAHVHVRRKTAAARRTCAIGARGWLQRTPSCIDPARGRRLNGLPSRIHLARSDLLGRAASRRRPRGQRETEEVFLDIKGSNRVENGREISH